MSAQHLPADPAARRAAVLVFAVITLLLVAGGYWYYREESKEIHQEKYDQLAAIASLKAKQVEDWRKERLAETQRTAQDALTVKAVSNFLVAPGDLVIREALARSLKEEMTDVRYANILLFDREGRQLFASKDERWLESVVIQKNLQAAFASQTAVLSDFYRHTNGMVHIDAAAVVRDGAGRFLAILVQRHHAGDFLFSLLQFWPAPTRTAETVLSQQEGAEVVFINPLRNVTNAPMTLRFPLTRTSLPAVQAALGKEGICEGIDYRGVPVLDHLHHIPGTSWTMITKVDQAEIFTEAHYRATVTMTIIGVLILLVAVMAAYSYRWRQTKGLLELYQAERQELQVQQALVKSQEQFTQLFENSPVATWLEDLTQLADWLQQLRTQGVKDLRVFLGQHPDQVLPALGLIRVLTVNRAAVAQNAAASEQELMANLPRLFTESTRVVFIEELAALWEGKTHFEFESRSARLDGQTLDLIVRVDVSCKDDVPDFSRVIITGTDITKRKQVETALQASESSLREAQVIAQVGSYDLDIVTGIWSSSEVMDEVFGIAKSYPHSLEGWTALIHPDERAMMGDYFNAEVLGRKQAFDKEYRILRQNDQAERWVHGQGRLEFDAAGRPVKMRGIIHDITEHKEKEAALRKSEERWQFALEGAGDGVWDWNAVTGKVFFSQQWKTMLGFEEHEIGSQITEWESRVHPEDIARCHEELESYFSGKTPAYVSEHRMRCKDGSYKWILDRGKIVERTADGKPLRVIGTHSDITERKLAEDKLRNSDEKFRTLATLLPVGVYLADAAGCCVYANPGWCEMAGLRLEEALSDGWERVLHPEDREKTLSAWNKMVESEGQWGLEYRFQTPAGKVTWVYGLVTPHRDAAGKILGFVGVNMDITERKRAEAEMLAAKKQAETNEQLAEGLSEKLNEAQRIAEIGSWDWNLQANTVWWSAETYQIFEVKPGEYVPSAEANARFYHPDDAEAFGRQVEHSLKTGQSVDMDLRLVLGAGRLKHCRVRASVALGSFGKPMRFAGTIMDITAQKQVHEELRLSEQKLKSYIEHAGDAIYVLDQRSGRLLSCNQKACQELGYRQEELLQLSARDIEAQQKPEEIDQLHQLLAEKGVLLIEGVHRKKDGTTFPVEITLSRLDFSEPPCLLSIVRNVTERRRAEADLRESEERYRRLFELASVGILRLTSEGKIIWVNDTYARALGYTVEELMGVKPVDLDTPESAKLFPERLRRIMAGEVLTFEVDNYHKDGHIVPFEVSASRITFGGTNYFQAFVRDIAERKQAEEKLQASEQRYRATIESSPVPMALNDAEQNITYLNPAFVQTFGYTLADIPTIEAWWPKAYPDPQYRQRVAEAWKVALAEAARTGNKFAPMEAVVNCKDGTNKTVLVSAASLSSAMNKGEHMVLLYDITARKQAEKTNLLQTTALNAAANAIWITDREGTVQWVNPAFTQLTGYTAEESLGKNPRDLVRSGKQDQAFYQNLWNTILAGQVWRGIMVNCRKDGSLYTEEEIITPVRDAAGQVTHFIAVKEDITGRQEAEAAILHRSKLNRALINLPTVAEKLDEKAFMQHGLELAETLTGSQIGFIHFVNLDQQSIELVTWSRRTLEQYCHAVHETHYPADKAGIWADALRKREPVIFNDYPAYPHKKGLPEGHSVLKRLVSVPVLEGGRVGLITGVGNKETDYTEQDVQTVQIIAREILRIVRRRRAEASLRLEHAALEAAANAIVLLDCKGTVQWVNAAFTKFTGYTVTEAMGQNPRVLKSGKHEQAFYKNIWDTVLAGNVWQGEIINKRKDGTLYTEDMTITPLKDAQGKVTHFIAVKQDITQRKLLEEQYRQSQKMQAFGQLAGGVAHDFNNILGSVIMQVAMTRMLKNLPVEVEECLDQVRADAERAANLTRQLLLFSRKQVTQLRDLDLNELVANLAKMLQRIIGEDISLKTILQPGSAPVRADASMIEQVLLNLAVNARDAMAKGGQLEITLQKVVLDEAAATRHLRSRPGSFVRLSVADTGTGIPPEVLGHIFEPFFTTKDVGKGTGLGLATVHGILEQHHGWVEVESQVGQGTVFHIYLPRLAEKPVTMMAAEVVRPVRGGSETILVVEDEPSLRKILTQTLQQYGYTVLVADSGLAAMELWPQHRQSVSLLVTDIIMPGGVSGSELATQLQADKPALKVLYISGYSGETAGHGLDLRDGVNFLPKPFSAVKLARTIRTCLGDPPA